MTVSEETIREVVEILAAWASPDDHARELDRRGLLRQEMTEEYVIGDGFGEPELWRGTFDSREEAEAALACDCHREILRRYVTEWACVCPACEMGHALDGEATDA